ncbi:formyltetrahydrofolate deformylase [Kinneretia aquatilis]|uniref:formyltetrahydrofolate deformylase n=1 Tax=Kinneretia aquatilis TaxID=2070761 RepID=UPI000BCBDC82|nr:formyltetrahydrofolate deformylase [Paucibacter aquatile]MCZ8074991.1 formyltetrahydrofolate deformylase [Roseateles sp.]OYU27924.1 MAG: formyltetrahydrofolate deformylase [Burkholderiales bacterium PBB2]WIV99280.1 formyltetrahydrofolate deformylase [Paucibacter aquatile]
MSQDTRFILKLSCPDRAGIVHAVTGFLLEQGGNILTSAQHGDADHQRFFMRIEFECAALTEAAALQAAFQPLAERLQMDWELVARSAKTRVLLLVSKLGHCLNDLLFRVQTGHLPIEIPAIVSNHRDFYQLAASHNIPFHHFPLLNSTEEQKQAQERKIREVMAENQIDLVVLARYMQILSPELCRDLSGRAINIHHSFLPSFKGAKPYHQAYERGVKLIGATAHYVTSDLDEGPIIEQEVARIDHSLPPEQLVAIGRDTECVTLARAIQWHAEHRILLNGRRTVVFR